jgi:serine/threonine protein kinase
LKLGRYEVVRELGKGAMGIVYLAKDPLIGRLVALKTIRASGNVDEDEAKEFQQRFIREAQAAGILNHPAIVTVHDIGTDESGTSFIAMEYVEGQNLKEILSQGRALSFDQIADLISQVADALDFAHAKGIVHRDVKPANVIMVEGNRAKITDFGIAKIASSQANLTTTGQFLGTPNYMAPEQIKGLPVDGRSDLFSLGICLYECLTRRKPFGGDSLTTISYKIVHEPFPPLREVNPQIPEGYEEVVARCLSKDPARRYQRGRDFASALRAVARGEKPVNNDPVFADETIVTRHLDRVPTLQVPFPEASASGIPLTTQAAKVPAPAAPPVAASTPPPAPAAAAAPKPKKEKRPSIPPVQRFKTTLTNVRTAPLWRRSMHPGLFLGIVALFVLMLIGALVGVQKRFAEVPTVDRQAEQRRARERQLRLEGNRLLQERRFPEAYAKFSELSKMAPKSAAVAQTLQRLEAVRLQVDQTKVQGEAAQAKLQQGLDLYNQKKYAEAIPVLQEAFSMNPSSEEAANTLKLAQQEVAKAAAPAKTQTATKLPAKKTPGTLKTTTPLPAVVAVSSEPAKLRTVFNSPFKDGYIMVKVGADVVAHENLFEDKKGLFRRRAARSISVTKEFPAKNADLQVWVVVPSLSIQEHKTMAQTFAPGSSQTITVTYDANGKRFDYRIE